MIKSAFSILLIVAIKLQVVFQLLVIGNFILNQNQFAEQCENKALLEMQCNGKCQMAKILSEATPIESNKKSLPDLIRFMNEFQPAIIENMLQAFFLRNNLSDNLFFTKIQYTLSGHPIEILRPPTA